MDANLVKMHDAIVEAVSADQKAGKSLKKAAPFVFAFYGGKQEHIEKGDVDALLAALETYNQGKAQFLVDHIVPGLDAKHRTAYHYDIPHSNSKGYPDFEKDKGGSGAVAEMRKAQAAAKATAHTYFSRLGRHAFGDAIEEAKKIRAQMEAEAQGKTTDEVEAAQELAAELTWFNERLAAIIKRAQKSESLPFDVPAFVKLMEQGTTVLNTPKS